MTYNYNRSGYYKKINKSDEKWDKKRLIHPYSENYKQKIKELDTLIIDENTVYEIDEDCIKRNFNTK